MSGGYNWVVPVGITTATFDLTGASGAGAGGSRGGNGGETVATIAVSPGETLQINVGGGGSGTYQGIGGGGQPGLQGDCSAVTTSYFGCFGAYGGGASDIRQGGTALLNRVLVAGGGGGAGGPGNDHSAVCSSPCSNWSGGDGGDAGGLAAVHGADGVARPIQGASEPGGCGGTGATQAAQGSQTGGIACNGVTGGSQAGNGGNGRGNGISNNYGGGTGSGTGGGGGAGYFGGGGGDSGYGGAGGGGGGGGSSFAAAAASNVSIRSAVNLGNGKVTVTYGAQVLSVVKSGSGAGNVTSSPSGIDCGATCSNGYAAGAMVTLTATPAAGSSFTGWSGAGCAGSGGCTVTMSSDQTVTATFTSNSPPPPNVTGAAAPKPVTPSSSFTTTSATVDPKTGTVTFTESVTDPGTFRFTLTFPNGQFGVFAAGKTARCRTGRVKLNGRCRPAALVFGAGSNTVAVSGTVSFTVAPSASAVKALKRALKRNRGVSVTAALTYQSARGGAPVSHTQSIIDKLAKAKKKGKK